MPAARYWRIVAIDTYAGADLELSALHLYGGAARLDTASTIASTFAPTVGTLAALQDDDLASTCRFAAAAVRAGGFAIVWDFGAGNTADVTGLRLGAATSRGDFLAGCTLQYSQDGALWKWRGYFSRYDYPGAGAYTDVQAAGYDEHFDKVALLLHMDGADGSTTLTDSSPSQRHVATSVSGARITNATSKFGGSSLYLHPNGYVSTPMDVGLQLGAGDFTVEMWVHITNAAQSTSFPRIAGVGRYQQLGGWNLVYIKPDKSIYLDFYGSGTVVFGLSCGAPIDGAWNHVAFTRSGTTVRTFLNGSVVSTGASSFNLNCSDDLVIGAHGTVDGFLAGYIDDLRITKGVARYTADFTPPTVLFSMPTGVSVFLPPLLARIAASSPVPPHSTLRAPPMLLARDVEFGGPGRIWGTTKIETSPGNLVPTKSRVSILRGRDKLLAREVWSDPVTGEWEAKGLDTRQDFVVLAQDSAGNYQPVAADKTLPEAP